MEVKMDGLFVLYMIDLLASEDFSLVYLWKMALFFKMDYESL